MDINSPEIQALKAKVRAADEEFAFAQECHETWKPAAYDIQLHERIGYSYVANAFNLIRLALRREMVLGLMRLWDKDKRTVDMQSIANALSDTRIVDALASNYAAFWTSLEPPNLRDIPEYLRSEFTELISAHEKKFGQEQGNKLRERASEAVSIIRKYQKDGSGYRTLDRLRDLRNERLAHRNVTQPTPTEVATPIPSDEEIEIFYKDMAELIRLLLVVVHQTDYRPDDTAKIHAKNAAYFWASVRGERTEGHPNYQAPSSRSQHSPDGKKVP
ncbi:MAG: hypothetical protein AB7T18_15210 [Alphaproteobacteria bacterium]